VEPIKIIVLGMSGAGKTVYLASLYQKLSVQSNDGCYSLATSASISTRLSRAYASVRDPLQEWPRGTRSVDYIDVPFDCVVNNQHGKFTVMRLLYLDYAGGVLSAELDDPAFFARLEESDAFLVLIDGAKVLKALGREVAAGEALETDLDAVLGHVQGHIQKPLHFVLTKWDLLDETYTLHDVVALLSKNRHFQGILEQRRQSKTVTRLIPVSAVGKGFARLSRQGKMIKTPGARAHPENVDLPISCLLYDLVSTAKSRIEDERLRVGFLVRLWYRIMGSTPLITSVGKFIVNKLPIPLTPELIKHVLTSALSELQASAESSRERTRDRYGSAVLEAQSTRQAFDAIVAFHGLELHWLKKQFPASTLSEAYRG
jgi:GTPase SAR1 family protein